MRIRRHLRSFAQAKLLRIRRITRKGCWIRTKRKHAYSSVRFDGKTWNAHALSAEVWIKRRPGCPWVLHHCDNRACFNPTHLYRGKPKHNARDMMARGRGKGQFSRMRCSGENHPQAKLSNEAVTIIKKELDTERRGTQSALAVRFGVTIQQINRIKFKRSRNAL